MDVLVIGGHGKVALRLLRRLAAAGDGARGSIRDPGHAGDLEAAGAVPVVCDLERDPVDPLLEGVDALVFAAGAGPGSGDARKRTVDYGGAVACIEAAERRGVRRFLLVSSIGAQDPEGGPEAMRPYLRAKAEADARLAASDLDWTIVRPGMLTDDPGTGRIAAHTDLGHRGPVPRDDVAATLEALLRTGAGARVTFELLAGATPIDDALAALRG